MKTKLLLTWLVIISFPLLVFSQTRQVTGTITDANGTPVPLASVIVRGTNTGVAADENGRFSLPVSGSNPVLIISSVGYQNQEIRAGNNNNLTIVLQGTDELSEVVVTALGSRREKKALGYSSQEVKGDELIASQQANIVNALRGKVAGVQINSGCSVPGQGSLIIIRGIKSLDPSRDNQPCL